MTTRFDDETGWVSLVVLAPPEVATLLAACRSLAKGPATERDARDKPVSGTRHLRNLTVRLPQVGDLVSQPPLLSVVHQIVGVEPQLEQAEYRCPQPGFGGQKLHADWLPKIDDAPASVATAIVALTEFTASNGATRVVPGSHRRPDLQRRAGQLETHPDERVLTGPAGTAFIFSGHLLHAGGANNSRDERPALQLIWHRAG